VIQSFQDGEVVIALVSKELLRLEWMIFRKTPEAAMRTRRETLSGLSAMRWSTQGSLASSATLG